MMVRECVCVGVYMCVCLWARVWALAGTRTCVRVCEGAHMCVRMRVRLSEGLRGARVYASARV